MINIQPYITQLDLLREYMFEKIDCYGIFIELNLDALPTCTPEQVFKLYSDTGWFLPSKKEYLESISFITFEEYLNSKQQ